MLLVRPRYTSIWFFSRIGASLLLAPIVSNTWLSALALHIAVRVKSFGRCALRGLVSNGGLSALALRFVVRASRFAIGKWDVCDA